MPSEIGLTILIVEDEKSIRKLIGMALAEAGYTVLEAGNSAEAVRAFQTSPNGVDLVIMDLVMPGGGGLDATNELRAIRADLKILYITGYRDTTLSRCIAEGAPSAE